MPYLELCIDCNAIKTSSREADGSPVCSGCSNKRYCANVSIGRIVELRLDMSKIKNSTYLQIQALIAKDIEEAIKEPA